MKKLCGVLALMMVLTLAGCSLGNQEQDMMSVEQDNGVDFTYYYHGFLIEKASEDAEIAPDGVYVIDTQEEYEAFISKYDMASIYQLDTVDFDSECLIYQSNRSAQPSRGWSSKITAVNVSDDRIELVQDETVNYDAENEDEAVAYQLIGDTDCAVREVFFLKVQKDALSEGLRDLYQPE